MNQTELSIVIPGYNESVIIEDNLKTIYSVVTDLGITFEIIFVDDGSTDNTKKIASELAKRYSELNLISYKNNRGRGYALRQGFLQTK